MARRVGSKRESRLLGGCDVEVRPVGFAVAGR